MRPAPSRIQSRSRSAVHRPRQRPAAVPRALTMTAVITPTRAPAHQPTLLPSMAPIPPNSLFMSPHWSMDGIHLMARIARALVLLPNMLRSSR
jgi:hypothetical protein